MDNYAMQKYVGKKVKNQHISNRLSYNDYRAPNYYRNNHEKFEIDRTILKELTATDGQAYGRTDSNY